MEAFAKQANGYGREAVIEAAGNIILNALRQGNPRLVEAEEQLDDLALRLKSALRKDHYTKDGVKNGLIILSPELHKWLRSEGALR